MAVPTVFRQVRGDMEIRTSNGVLLGRVVDVLWGTDVSGQRHSLAQLGIRETGDTEDESVASNAGVSDAVLRAYGESSGDTIFVPHQAVAGVSERCVLLYVDDLAANVSNWHRPPAWIQADGQVPAHSS